jgi:MSHA type pilus biogenesis protein MshL
LIPWLQLLILSMCLAACQNARENHARHRLTHDALEDLKSPPASDQPPPLLSPPYKPPPKPPAPQPTLAMKKRVSLALTEALPIKQVFWELSRQTGVDLQLDPKIEGKLVFSAKDRPFLEVIDHLCHLVDLRYRLIGPAVRIEVDTPYAHNYNIQFLNSARAAQNRISIATDVFAANGGAGKATADNGSNSTVSATSSNDFWLELENNLKIILGADREKGSSYALHKQGGLIAVFATERQHQLLDRYLQQLRRVVSAQVLIEAKVIEVTLHDEFRSGINWQKLTGGSLYFDGAFGQIAPQGRLATPQAAQSHMLTLGFRDKGFTAILRAIEEFGASQTLSSPRLTVMNNQTAILKVAQNQVYFRLRYDKQVSLNVNRENISVSSDIQTVPIGLVMSVQPSIDGDTGEIILSLRPTISRLTQSVRDPAVDIALTTTNPDSLAQIKPSLIPVVEVREIDSVLRLKSGEIAVLGGLMEIRTTNERSQLPLLGDLPILGEAFSANTDSQQVVELVILLRATIAERMAPAPDAADNRLYRNYGQDPRPWGKENEEESEG